MTNSEMWRLRRSAMLHGLAFLIFAMLAVSGATTAAPGLYGMAVPFMVTGTAGALGAALITVSVWRGQRGETAAPDGAAATGPSKAPQRAVRLAMGGAAVVALIAGVLLAPRGMDRGFVIGVAALLAVSLASFALLAGDRPRTAAQPTGADHPR